MKINFDCVLTWEADWQAHTHGEQGDATQFLVDACMVPSRGVLAL